MARKKSDPPKQVFIAQFKGSPQYKEWFDRLVEAARMPNSVLIDIAVKEWAERNGFKEKPPVR